MDIQDYTVTKAIDCINNGKGVPTYVYKHEIKLKYVSTDGWRGYYETIPTRKSKWVRIDSDWITGEWEDAGEHAYSKVKARQKKIIQTVEDNGGELIIVLTPTSNVFSTGMDVFVRGLPSAIINSLSKIT
jgi:hypothetical protein